MIDFDDDTLRMKGVQICYYPQNAGLAKSSIFVGNGGRDSCNISGGSDPTDLSGRYNTGVGMANLVNLTTGSYNTAVGFESQMFMTTGKWNTSFGEATMIYHAAHSNYNLALGTKAFSGKQTGCAGDYNTYIGTFSGFAHYQGNFNIGLGPYTMYGMAGGSHNICIGAYAGYDLTTGSGNILIGYGLGFQGSSVNYSIKVATPIRTWISADEGTGMVLGGGQNVYLGANTLAPNATQGFPIIPMCNGTPTGAAPAGAMVMDTAAHQLCFSLGGGTWIKSPPFS